MNPNKGNIVVGVLRTLAIIGGIIFYHHTAWYDMKDTDSRGFSLTMYIFFYVVLVVSIMANFDFNIVRWIRSKIK